MSVAETEVLFSSTHSALKFALNFSHGTLQRPALAMLLGGATTGRGLSGLDGAAQAGMILAELGRLSQTRQAVIVARLENSQEQCACRQPCCRGYRESLRWSEAVDYLCEYVLKEGLGGTISHYHLRRSLIIRHFGGKESFLFIAASCGVNRHTAGEYYKRVTERFKGQEKLAFAEIDSYLRGAGVVGN